MLPLPATALIKAPALVKAALLNAAATTGTTVPKAAQATDHSIFSPIAKPIADVLAAFYSLIPNYGVAIILLSLAWMVIIAPLTLKSTRSMLAMQKLQPQLKKLQAEHKNDRQAFAAAQMELFKEHNVSPFGSCLPTLLPLPVFFALFRVIDGLSHHVKVNGVSYPDPNFLAHNTAMYKAIYAANGHINAFGLDLSKNALSGHSSFAAALPFYVLLLIMIGTQYLQTAQMMSRNPAANDNPQMKMMKYLPIFFGVICIRFPAGVILYYAMSNICRMGQQTLMYRYDPKVRTLAAREVLEVEAMTRDIDRRSGTIAAKSTKKAPDTTPPNSAPARNSRFRDALAQASKQAAEGRAKKAPDAGKTPPGKTPDGKAPDGRAKPGVTPPKPGATPPRSAGARSASANRPANGGTKGRPVGSAKSPPPPRPTPSSGPANPSQATRARNRNGSPGTPAAPAGSNGNGSTASKPPAASGRGGANGNGNGAGVSPAANGNGNTSTRPGGSNGASAGAAGNGSAAAATGGGAGASAAAAAAAAAKVASPPVRSPTNGSGAEPAAPANPGTANGTPASGSKPPGAGAGRTGASQPRTPRKRRGR